MQDKNRAKGIRKQLGWSLNKVAGVAGVSTPTVKLYEVDRLAVSESKRSVLDEFYAKLEGGAQFYV